MGFVALFHLIQVQGADYVSRMWKGTFKTYHVFTVCNVIFFGFFGFG